MQVCKVSGGVLLACLTRFGVDYLGNGERKGGKQPLPVQYSNGDVEPNNYSTYM